MNDGGTFRAEQASTKIQGKLDKQLSLRRSLDNSFRIERLNSSLSVKQSADIVIPPGIEA